MIQLTTPQRAMFFQNIIHGTCAVCAWRMLFVTKDDNTCAARDGVSYLLHTTGSQASCCQLVPANSPFFNPPAIRMLSNT